MKPQVTLNQIPFSDDIRYSVPNTDINTEGKKLQKHFNSIDVKDTFDGENPWVTIVCEPSGVKVDKNF